MQRKRQADSRYRLEGILHLFLLHIGVQIYGKCLYWQENEEENAQTQAFCAKEEIGGCGVLQRAVTFFMIEFQGKSCKIHP
jgi:hypothetical protein